jgi:hypothetical protein
MFSFVCDRIRFRDFVLFLLFPLDECTSGEEKKKNLNQNKPKTEEGLQWRRQGYFDFKESELAREGSGEKMRGGSLFAPTKLLVRG